MSAVDPVSPNRLNPSAATRAARPTTPRQRQLKEAVDEAVGSIFFGEVFKRMRESKLKGPYGHGGRGEEIFSAQLHETLAKRMSHQANFRINDALYARLAKGL